MLETSQWMSPATLADASTAAAHAPTNVNTANPFMPSPFEPLPATRLVRAV